MKYLINFNHIDGVWEALDEETRNRHTEFLAKFMADLKAEQNTELVFLAPPDQTRTVRLHEDGEMRVTDGLAFPRAETVGGYYIVDVDTEEEAIEWARRGRFLTGSNEVRPILDFTL